MGFWKARFSLAGQQRPDANHSLKSKNFQGWVEDTDLVTNSPKSLAGYERVKASVEKKRAEYWPVWQEKSAEAVAERTPQAWRWLVSEYAGVTSPRRF